MSENRIDDSIVYGPVLSRRFGRSLGINISGTEKNCSFNCIYCFRGFNTGSSANASFPEYKRIVEEIDKYFVNNDMSLFDDITIAGNGEPTDNQALPAVIDYLHDLRKIKQGNIKISILTNGMGFVPTLNPNLTTLLASTEKLDRLCVKLDSGNLETWRKINNPSCRVEFDEWFAAINKLRKVYVQTMLVNGRLDNTSIKEIKSLADCYMKLNPYKVYLLTLDKPPADKGLISVPPDKMQRIREYIVTNTQILVS